MVPFATLKIGKKISTLNLWISPLTIWSNEDDNKSINYKPSSQGEYENYWYPKEHKLEESCYQFTIKEESSIFITIVNLIASSQTNMRIVFFKIGSHWFLKNLGRND